MTVSSLYAFAGCMDVGNFLLLLAILGAATELQVFKGSMPVWTGISISGGRVHIADAPTFLALQSPVHYIYVIVMGLWEG